MIGIMVTSKATKAFHLTTLAVGAMALLLAADSHNHISWVFGIPGFVAVVWAGVKTSTWID